MPTVVELCAGAAVGAEMLDPGIPDRYTKVELVRHRKFERATAFLPFVIWPLQIWTTTALATNGSVRAVVAVALSGTGTLSVLLGVLMTTVGAMSRAPDGKNRRAPRVLAVLPGVALTVFGAGLLTASALLAGWQVTAMSVGTYIAFIVIAILLYVAINKLIKVREPHELYDFTTVHLADALSLALFGNVARFQEGAASIGRDLPYVWSSTSLPRWWEWQDHRDSLIEYLEGTGKLLASPTVRPWKDSRSALRREAMREHQLRIAAGFVNLAHAAAAVTPATGPRITASLAAGYVAACRGRWDELATADPLAVRRGRVSDMLKRLATAAVLVCAAIWVAPQITDDAWATTARGLLGSAALVALTSSPREAATSIRDGVADRIRRSG